MKIIVSLYAVVFPPIEKLIAKNSRNLEETLRIKISKTKQTIFLKCEARGSNFDWIKASYSG